VQGAETGVCCDLCQPAIAFLLTSLACFGDNGGMRYTDLAAAIQLARSQGMTDTQIVRALTGSMIYRDALQMARRAAPLMDLTVREFMGLRKNHP
jgi:hypothetical protein